ncbi:zinc-ribbon domain containing protein [Rosistilla ulvae]|nr:zinc-ribbon domain containing protein [Rosistilla ulvae]
MNRRRQKRRIAEGGLPPGAVAADTTRQVPISSYGSPKTFYVDVAFKCCDCGSDEVWTAKQQKWFYETAKGSLHATAVRCRECRNRLKDAKELQRKQMQSADDATDNG